MRKALVICGATATGKTALAVACAKKLNTEILSADSMLIYKNCNIGTAKPTLKERDGILHHLIDIVEPENEFSVSEYEETAMPILNRLISEEKVPIICGGTGFYIKSLLFQSKFGNTPKSESIRKKYDIILAEKGKEYLHGILRNIDAESAEKLHPNDTMRVIRALEIYELTGKKKSEQNDVELERFPYLAVQIDFNREELYDRINRRVDMMFQEGLVDEVRSLMHRGITDKNQCMQGIGYKELYYALHNNLSLEDAKEQIKQNSRNYAKRQITFFKKLKNINYLPSVSVEENADRILEML